MTGDARTIFVLRRETFATAAGLSLILFLTCPMVFALLHVVAYLGWALLTVLTVLMLIAGVVGIVAGTAVGLAGLFLGRSPGAALSGGLALLIGLGLYHLSPLVDVGLTVYASVVAAAAGVMRWYMTNHFWAWAWLPVSAAAALALLIFLTIAVLQYSSIELRRFRQCHEDCPHCHHRQAAKYHCSQCGHAQDDPRPSKEGVFLTRCVSCGKFLPTLDSLGRRRLRRSCRFCFQNLDTVIGSRPVSHVLLISDDTAPSVTVLRPEGKRLIYLHCAPLRYFSPQAAADSLRYLTLLDEINLQLPTSLTRELDTCCADLICLLERAKLRQLNRPLPLRILIKPCDGAGNVEQAAWAFSRCKRRFGAAFTSMTLECPTIPSLYVEASSGLSPPFAITPCKA